MASILLFWNCQIIIEEYNIAHYCGVSIHVPFWSWKLQVLTSQKLSS